MHEGGTYCDPVKPSDFFNIESNSEGDIGNHHFLQDLALGPLHFPIYCNHLPPSNTLNPNIFSMLVMQILLLHTQGCYMFKISQIMSLPTKAHLLKSTNWHQFS